MNNQIDARHLQRLAAVYVRQSSPGQVRNNQESRQRQRALKERACQLGWPEERVLVLEEDQGRTASSTHGRQAYHELAEKVVSGRVGIILAVEVSRWARDNAAWQLLLRDCIFADVLLADEQRLYDPNDPHDHVVLGIQGVLAEYELGLLRRRMLECYWKKAQRGEMFTNIANGYIEVRGQGLVKHPDQRVQHSLERMFKRFEHTVSVMKLCQWYLDHEESLPYVAHGDDPYHVQWLPANYDRVLGMLKNPAYTGAYVLGRTRTFVRRSEDGELVRERRLVPPDQWKVLEKNRFPAYISWEQYERNLLKIQGNATMKGDASQAAPQRGAALLAGLLRCGRCGRRLAVHYERGGETRYACRKGWHGREPREQRLSLSGRRAEPLFVQALLEALRPAALEASRRAAELGEAECRQQQQRLSEELQQCEYEAERARRQYDRVEPENRLVAAELEQRWNAALSQVAAARARLEEFQTRKNAALSETELARLMSLGQRLDSIWDAEQTDATIKKQVVRLLVEEVLLQPGKSPEDVELWIHWKGGHHTPLTVPRIAHRRGHAAEAKLVIGVLRAVCDDAGLAHALNRNGVRCGPATWTAESVRAFRHRHGMVPFDPAQKQSQGLLTGEEAATALGISTMSVHRLVQRGVVPAEQPAPGFPMVIRQSDLSRPEVQQAAHRIQLSLPRPLPADPNQLTLF